MVLRSASGWSSKNLLKKTQSKFNLPFTRFPLTAGFLFKVFRLTSSQVIPLLNNTPAWLLQTRNIQQQIQKPLLALLTQVEPKLGVEPAFQWSQGDQQVIKISHNELILVTIGCDDFWLVIPQRQTLQRDLCVVRCSQYSVQLISYATTVFQGLKCRLCYQLWLFGLSQIYFYSTFASYQYPFNFCTRLNTSSEGKPMTDFGFQKISDRGTMNIIK